MAIDLGVGVLPTLPLGFASGVVERAEEEGLHSVMVPDHLMAWFSEALWSDVGNASVLLSSPHKFLDPFPLIGYWAAETARLRFATAVTDPIRRPPAQLAASAMTLDHLTGGRFSLGLGCGEAENCLPYGLPFDRPVARLEEALRIIRALWSEGRVTMKGEFWSLDRAVQRLEPFGASHPEIWIGAHGPRMLELVGRYGDGWLPFMPFTPEVYARNLETVRKAAEAAGRDPTAITAGLNTPVAMADDHEKAHSMIASAAARQFLLALNEDFFRALGLEHPLHIRHGVTDFIPEWLEESELRAALASLPPGPFAHDLIIHGTPQDVARQLRSLEEAGLQYFAPLDAAPLTDISLLPTSMDRVVELSRALGR